MIIPLTIFLIFHSIKLIAPFLLINFKHLTDTYTKKDFVKYLNVIIKIRINLFILLLFTPYLMKQLID